MLVNIAVELEYTPSALTFIVPDMWLEPVKNTLPLTIWSPIKVLEPVVA